MKLPTHKNSLEGLAFAKALDEADPLRDFRNRFLLPKAAGNPSVYFLGNSLGLQPKATQSFLQEILDAWSQQGVESFFNGSRPWLAYHDMLVAPLATVVGALPQEVVAMNALTVNLHLMLASFYRPEGRRCKILCEAKAFPSDQYMFASHVRSRGLDPEHIVMEVQPSPGEQCISTEAILSSIDRYRDELALVLFSGVNYYTGQCFDMQAITAAGKAAGAVVGFDLAHAAGNVPLQLHDWKVDFACWCHYKYLNAGPGSVGGVFIHAAHHQDKNRNRLAGWWGCDNASRFAMDPVFVPANGAEGWQLSTPPLLLLSTLHASLAIFAQAGMERLHHKREALTAYLWQVLTDVASRHSPAPFQIITPRQPVARGCQVSLWMQHQGKKVYDQLMRKGFFIDWREPDVIRLAPVPLYNTFEEVFLFGEALEAAIQETS